MSSIKLCPTCGTENAPASARCACGTFLIGVDLTERAPQIVTPPPVEATPAPAEPADSAAAAFAGPVCSHPDCAQPNPAGSTVCVYCNRPLPVPSSPTPVATVPPAPAVARHDNPPTASRRFLVNLPAGLAQRFDIVEPLKAAGGEADLLIVRDRAAGEQAVLKLYRHGIEPRTDVLERVSRAAPDQLVRLIEHGRDEGVPYELLEYCEHGSLRSLFKGRPLPLEAARTLLTELADAIAHLHEFGIVHRDLKPENVLIRGLLPLDLVLTDFGISSLTEATMHYTSAARTLRYSAPEAGSNWVGKPTDYWALGMMLVEAISGRHPFEGLSEAVIAHALVTRPIDVSCVADGRWQQLCRGLLARDPKARWGATEIGRWLSGDTTLTVAEERAAPTAGEVPPYRVGETECRTPRELAVALASNWAIGVKDLKRGMLRAWLQNDLRDQNLARQAADAEEALELSDDERLLRLLLKLDPDLPPVFKGYDVTPAGLAALTRKALEENNEQRQAVLEMVERRILTLFPGSPLQEAQIAFEQAKAEFEQALERAFQAGAARELAPGGQEWQLRMLLFVLDPPKGLVENLRASARRVGGRAAQQCEWYRALGDPATASPATAAALVLFGPPAAREGIALIRDRATRALARLSASIAAAWQLQQQLGGPLKELEAAIETAQDEDAALALPALVAALEQRLGRAITALWQNDVFDGRAVTDAARSERLRRRIGDWARWRAGDAWAGFGAQIQLVQVTERRSYKLRLESQIETRRVPYKYSASDLARMPAGARATVEDVWACPMAALPEFGAGLKLPQPREIRCARCNASGRAELQESWGTTSYPFSSTFACHDKVGVQCQTRIAWANEVLPVTSTPQFVADFVESHPQEEDARERTIELMAPGIHAEWLAGMPEGPVKRECLEKLGTVARDVKPGERITAQRLHIAWTGLTEVRYRYQGKDYAIWVPERADALPIALEHPLPMEPVESGSAPEPETEEVTAPVAFEPSAPEATRAEPLAIPQRSSATAAAPAWIKTVSWWGAIVAALICLVTWMVNWKP